MPGGIPWFAISSISESPVTRGRDLGRHERRQGAGDAQRRRRPGRTSTAKIAAAGGREDALRQPRARVVARGRPRVRRRRAATSSTTSSRTSIAPTTSARRGRRSPATCRTSRSTSSSRTAKNPNLLFVGNDTGVFVSIDRGARWVKMNNNMPNIPVHDLLVHPREHDLDRRHVRARHLDHEHRAAAGADARPCSRRTCTSSRSSRRCSASRGRLARTTTCSASGISRRRTSRTGW